MISSALFPRAILFSALWGLVAGQVQAPPDSRPAPMATEASRSNGASLMDQESGDRSHELVDQLGSDTFRARERATRQLLAMGMRAMPSVQAGLASADHEIRRRCRHIARVVLVQHRSRRLTAFLATASDSGESLPGWQRIQGLLDDAFSTRRLLVEILTDHWELMDRFERSVQIHVGTSNGRHVVNKLATEKIEDAPLPSVTAMVIRELEQLKYRRDRRKSGASMAHIAAILVMAREPLVDLDSRQSGQLLGILHRLSRTADGSNPWENRAFNQLVGGYLERCTERMNAYQACTLALRYNIPQGLTPALAMIENQMFAAHEQQYGILTVAKLGGPEHVETLETVFDDERVCFRRAQNNQECQLRDVALAAAIYLSDQDPRDYGYAHLQRNSYSVYQVNSLYFPDEKTRETAFAKWEGFRNHPPAPGR